MTKPVYTLPQPPVKQSSTRGESLFSHLSPTDRVKFIAMVAETNKRVDTARWLREHQTTPLLPAPQPPVALIPAWTATKTLSDWRQYDVATRAATIGQAAKLPYADTPKSKWERIATAVCQSAVKAGAA